MSAAVTVPMFAAVVPADDRRIEELAAEVMILREQVRALKEAMVVLCLTALKES